MKNYEETRCLDTRTSGAEARKSSTSPNDDGRPDNKKFKINNAISGPQDMDIYRNSLSDGGMVMSPPLRQRQIKELIVAVKANATDGSANNKTRKIMVPFIVYEQVRDWFTQLRWSYSFYNAGSRPSDHDTTHYTVTWAELVTDYASLSTTNTQIPGDDLEDQCSVMRMIIRRICRLGMLLDSDGNKYSYKSFFRPACACFSLKWITGLRLPGLMRRPIWSKERTKAIFTELLKVYQSTPQAAGFGRGYSFGKGYQSAQGSKPKICFSTHGRLAPLRGPCVHGHDTTSASDNGRPKWFRFPDGITTRIPAELSGRPGDVVCSRCYSKLVRIKTRNNASEARNGKRARTTDQAQAEETGPAHANATPQNNATLDLALALVNTLVARRTQEAWQKSIDEVDEAQRRCWHNARLDEAQSKRINSITGELRKWERNAKQAVWIKHDTLRKDLPHSPPDWHLAVHFARMAKKARVEKAAKISGHITTAARALCASLREGKASMNDVINAYPGLFEITTCSPWPVAQPTVEEARAVGQTDGSGEQPPTPTPTSRYLANSRRRPRRP